LKGCGIEDVHCTCSRRSLSTSDESSDDNKQSRRDNSCDELDTYFLSPIANAKVFLEGKQIFDETLLQQGHMITLGDSIFLRFNFPAKANILKSNAIECNKKKMNDNYGDVLRKSLNTNCVNFTEFSINRADKTLNNNVKITDKMKNMKLKANDSYPKITNLQVYPISSKSIENCANLSLTTSNSNIVNNNNSNVGNADEMQQLEDVLKMFVEYNNNNSNSNNQSRSGSRNTLQTSSDKINVSPPSSSSLSVQHQNRIKTNGSLPKNFHTKDHGHNFDFYDSDSKSTDDIEVYKKPQSPRTRIKTFVSSPSSISSSKSLSPPADNNDKISDKIDTTTSTQATTNFATTSNEKEYERLIKSFEDKFRMDIYNIQNCENLNHNESNNANNNNSNTNDYKNDVQRSAIVLNETSSDSNHLQPSNLNCEKNEILTKIRELKILISDIQYQESEAFLESDVEKSLVLAEMSNEKSNLSLLNEKLSAIKIKMKQFEMERLKRQKQQEIQQIKLKNVIKDKEAEIKMIQEQNIVTEEVENRFDELQKSLELDKKTYEDLEFHYLEEETEW
jgi:hypothetical protein